MLEGWASSAQAVRVAPVGRADPRSLVDQAGPHLAAQVALAVLEALAQQQLVEL